MSSQRHRSSSGPIWAWLLWLALVLPLAQTAATWHVVSHGEEQAGGHAQGKHARGLAHCDLCLTAAALSGGASVGENDLLPVVAAHEVAPRDPAASIWQAPLVPAYRSRAPPNSAS
jgi:hypothetical protein